MVILGAAPMATYEAFNNILAHVDYPTTGQTAVGDARPDHLAAAGG
jgi:hypothetical protein